MERSIRISCSKGGRTLGVGFVLVPLELKGLKQAVSLFYIVNLLLLLRAPEPALGKTIILSIIPREGFLRHKGNQKKDIIQKYYNNFGIESKNVVRFLDSGFSSDEKLQDRLYHENE